jgi:hypothetical protein
MVAVSAKRAVAWRRQSLDGSRSALLYPICEIERNTRFQLNEVPGAKEAGRRQASKRYSQIR